MDPALFESRKRLLQFSRCIRCALRLGNLAHTGRPECAHRVYPSGGDDGDDVLDSGPWSGQHRDT